MTSPVAKAVDALLATRTAPWVELLSPKAPAGAGPAQSVLNAARVDNDVLLPHGNALRASQAAAAEVPRAVLADTPVRTASSTDLSAAARIIQNLLADMREGESAPVRGHGPVWPAARELPTAAALASGLSQQVSDSGLFYESHLAQFAAGTRSLAQMQREPQAGLSREGAERQGAQPEQAGTQQRAALQVQLLPMAASQAQAAAMPAPAAASPVVGAVPAQMHAMPDASSADAPVPTSKHADGASPQQRAQAGIAHPGSHAARAIESFVQNADATPAAQRPSAAPAAPDANAGAVVHPQAAPLVHQQLDVLASAMFRWSGEAWPGVPMEWSVQEEGGRAPDENDAQPPAAQWSTAMSLDLPRLGRVDLRMKLSGTSVHAQLAARERDALTQLRVHRAGLSQRLAAAGFELRALQLDAELAA